LIFGIAIITFIYVAMSAALVHALPVKVIGASNLAVADGVAAFAGSAGNRIVTLVSLVSVITIANLTIMYPSRTLYAMAQSGALPEVFGSVSQSGSPRVAILAATILTALMASSGAYLALTSVYAPLAMITATAIPLAAISLRRTEPNLARPWRMAWFPLPVLIALTVNLALLTAFLVEDPLHSAWSFVLLALGLPMLLRKPRAKRAQEPLARGLT
jgi:APA family basic amino acid/polyamine antiporter